MTGAAPSLEDLLALEQLDTLMFRGRSRGGTSVRVFGGEVAAQALVAAGRTVPADRPVHSLHGYFLRPGDPATPLLYRVDDVRDGGSFTTRRVSAIQHGETVFHLAASFHRGDEGFAHQEETFDAPAPESLPSEEDVMAGADPATRAWFAAVRDLFPLEVRFPEELPRLATLRGERRPPRQRLWIRSSQPLPEEPLLHACAATYASDLFLLSTALPPHGAVIGDPNLQFASLDHAVWFHAPFRADEWLLYEQESTWAGSGRALCRGTLFDRTGVHVASVMQEGMLRTTRGVPALPPR